VVYKEGGKKEEGRGRKGIGRDRLCQAHRFVFWVLSCLVLDLRREEEEKEELKCFGGRIGTN